MSNPSNNSMGQVLENALLSALQPLMMEIKGLKQEVNDLKVENTVLRQQMQDNQSHSQLEIQAALSNLLSSLKSFDERLEIVEQQHGFTQNLLKSMDRKLPSPLSLPMKLFINGETVTYRGLIAICLVIMTYTAGTVWIAEQVLPGIQQRSYQQINSIEIRLKRLENQQK